MSIPPSAVFPAIPPNPVTSTSAELFLKLFSGLEDAYQLPRPTGKTKPENGKCEYDYTNVISGSISLAVVESHLAGDQWLYIYPIHRDNQVNFGAIDVDPDDYRDFAAERARILGEIEKLGLYLLPCESKSGGLHLYGFFARRVTAESARLYFEDLARQLGLSDVEIFPKQDGLEAGEVGSGINMPLFGDERAALRPDGSKMTTDEALARAENLARDLGDITPEIYDEEREKEFERFELPDVIDAERNTTLYKFTRSMRWYGFNKAEITAAVGALNSNVARMPDPLSPYELSKTVLKMRRKMGADNALPECVTAGREEAMLDIGKLLKSRWKLVEAEILAVLTVSNQERCFPPLPDDAVKDVAAKAAKYKPRARKNSNPTKQTVKSVAEFIEENGGQFARGVGTDHVLYAYHQGRYRLEAEILVLQRAVKRYCEKYETVWQSKELAERVSDYLMPDVPEIWERPPLDIVNTQTGLLNVHTRVITPHSPEFLSPIQLPIQYDPSARCPNIEQLCSEILPSDTQDYILYQLAAWLMIPYTDIQKAILFFGGGSNGKSVLINVLADFIGENNCCASTLHKLESGRFATPVLVGKLANICADLPERSLSGTSVLKAITGGDYLDGERKFGNSFKFKPYSRLIFSANKYPRSDDDSHGMFRRWLIVPTEQRIFVEGEPGTIGAGILRARFAAELPGLLNKALDALPRVLQGSIQESDSMKSAWKEFRSTTDPLTGWLDENVVDVAESFIPKDDLVRRFNAYCTDKGKPGTTTTGMTHSLAQLRPNVRPTKRTVNKKEVWCYVGIGWREQQLTDPGF